MIYVAPGTAQLGTFSPRLLNLIAASAQKGSRQLQIAVGSSESFSRKRAVVTNRSGWTLRGSGSYHRQLRKFLFATSNSVYKSSLERVWCTSLKSEVPVKVIRDCDSEMKYFTLMTSCSISAMLSKYRACTTSNGMALCHHQTPTAKEEENVPMD
ncbi:hypothetical protein NPIL_334251 [Nephila pilipes]|uniref:Uncharacterized protein n=1 Tax=Nephila pilipes TaxID=299642 RepID=A0A8X6MWG0_NEPPI|nr:hypothetical protein NPIL_334251 [Nephila pilipes]